MAQFVSATTRRRRLLVSCAVSAVVALGVGAVIGRASVPTVAERASSVAAAGRDLATRIDALTIEYEQAVTGGGDTVTKGVDEPLDGIERELLTVLGDAPWVIPARRAAVQQAIARLHGVAADRAPTASFDTAAHEASELVREVLGVR